MAKLQIFVLALILAQGYCNSVSLSTLPAQQEQPVCVTYVKLLLQAIIEKLSNLPSVNRPIPEFEVPEVEVPLPEIDVPEVISPEPEVTEPEVTEPEVTKPEAPCTACFNYLTVLISSAEKVAATRRQLATFY